MRFEQEFRLAFPETVGETDKEFDLSNYVEWLESLVEEKFTPTNNGHAATALMNRLVLLLKERDMSGFAAGAAEIAGEWREQQQQ